MAAKSTTNSISAAPPKLVNKCAASRIHIVMKSDKETVDTLQRFDGFGTMVLGNVTEFEVAPEGRRITKLGSNFPKWKQQCQFLERA